MSKYLLVIFYLAMGFFAPNLFAKAEQNSTMNDPKAKIVLDKAAKVYNQNTGIYSKFTQIIEVPGGKANTKKGEVYLKGNKFKIKFTDQEIITNEKYIWTYLKSANEVQVNDYESDPSDITPSNMFKIYQKDFYYLQKEDEHVLGKSCFVIDLAPVDKSRSYFKVRVWIDKLTYNLAKIRIFDKNGYRYNYTINYINNKANLSDSIFNFNKSAYPGVKVEDLRF